MRIFISHWLLCLEEQLSICRYMPSIHWKLLKNALVKENNCNPSQLLKSHTFHFWSFMSFLCPVYLGTHRDGSTWNSQVWTSPPLCSCFWSLFTCLQATYKILHFMWLWYSMFYCSILDMLSKEYKNLLCHDAATQETATCYCFSPFMNSILVSSMKHQNSSLLLKHPWPCFCGKSCFLASALITVNNYVLHSLFSAKLLIFLCWFVGIPLFKRTHWQKVLEQSNVPMCKKAEEWVSSENQCQWIKHVYILNEFPLNRNYNSIHQSTNKNAETAEPQSRIPLRTNRLSNSALGAVL